MNGGEGTHRSRAAGVRSSCWRWPGTGMSSELRWWVAGGLDMLSGGRDRGDAWGSPMLPPRACGVHTQHHTKGGLPAAHMGAT